MNTAQMEYERPRIRGIIYTSNYSIYSTNLLNSFKEAEKPLWIKRELRDLSVKSNVWTLGSDLNKSMLKKFFF